MPSASTSASSASGIATDDSSYTYGSTTASSSSASSSPASSGSCSSKAGRSAGGSSGGGSLSRSFQSASVDDNRRRGKKKNGGGGGGEGKSYTVDEETTWRVPETDLAPVSYEEDLRERMFFERNDKGDWVVRLQITESGSSSQSLTEEAEVEQFLSNITALRKREKTHGRGGGGGGSGGGGDVESASSFSDSGGGKTYHSYLQQRRERPHHRSQRTEEVLMPHRPNHYIRSLTRQIKPWFEIRTARTYRLVIPKYYTFEEGRSAFIYQIVVKVSRGAYFRIGLLADKERVTWRLIYVKYLPMPYDAENNYINPASIESD